MKQPATAKAVFGELTYIANEIAFAMAAHPDKTAQEIAGSIDDPDSELARLSRALQRAQAFWLNEAA